MISYWEGASRAPLRIGLVVLAALSFLGDAWSLALQLEDPFYVARSPLLLAVWTPSNWAIGLVVVVGMSGLIAVGRGRSTWRVTVAALVPMALVFQWGKEITGDPSHNFLFPGAVLGGWLLGLGWARWLASRGVASFGVRRADEAVAEAAAVGVLAALYVGSGLSKVFENGGLSWVNPHTLREVLLTQQGVAHGGLVDAYRQWVVESPAVAETLAAAALVIELGGLAMLAGRRLRMVWGLLIVVLHLNILILTNIPYVEPMVLVPLFTLPWPLLSRWWTKSPPPAVAALPRGDEVPWPRGIVETTVGLVVLGLVLRLLS